MNNKSALGQSKNAGCYCCCKIFESKEVQKFTDNGQTGVCPLCSSDCVVGDMGVDLDESILLKANKFWFGD
jgi:NAD-dependent SIR2 family protein deacetylase